MSRLTSPGESLVAATDKIACHPTDLLDSNLHFMSGDLAGPDRYRATKRDLLAQVNNGKLH
jgi:hypothetical protein